MERETDIFTPMNIEDSHSRATVDHHLLFSLCAFQQDFSIWGVLSPIIDRSMASDATKLVLKVQCLGNEAVTIRCSQWHSSDRNLLVHLV